MHIRLVYAEDIVSSVRSLSPRFLQISFEGVRLCACVRVCHLTSSSSHAFLLPLSQRLHRCTRNQRRSPTPLTYESLVRARPRDRFPLELVPVELQQHVGASHAWLVCNVAFDQAVITRWRSLLQTVPVREMKLHRCLNCDVYTHATGNAANRILINRDLLVGRRCERRSRLTSRSF